LSIVISSLRGETSVHVGQATGWGNHVSIRSHFSKIANVPMSRPALANAYGVSRSQVSGSADVDDSIRRLKVVNRDGQHWLQQIFSHDNGGNSVGLGRTGTQYIVTLPGRRQYEEIYISFEQELKSDFVFTRGGKFGTGFLGGSATTTGGNRANGYNGIALRGSWNGLHAPDGGIGLYVAYADQRNGTTDGIRAIGDILWAKGQVQQVQIRAKLNTPETSRGRGNSKRDGILQMWVDGVLVIDRRNMRWRHNNLKINRFFYSNFYGGSSSNFATVKEETMWSTNHAISDKPLLYNPPR